MKNANCKQVLEDVDEIVDVSVLTSKFLLAMEDVTAHDVEQSPVYVIMGTTGGSVTVKR